MNPANILITGHAWERFIERMQAAFDEFPCCPMMTLQVILESCTPEDLGAGAVIRMLKNGMQPASYFRYGPLRLVMDEEHTRLITIEIAALKRPRHKHPSRRQRP